MFPCTGTSYVGTLFAKVGRHESDGIHEGVGIGEPHDLAMPKWPPPIDQAVVVRQPFEGIRVHQLRGGKPAAEDMDVGRGALVHARVHDLHNELGYAGGSVGALEDADVLVCAHICSKTINQLRLKVHGS